MKMVFGSIFFALLISSLLGAMEEKQNTDDLKKTAYDLIFELDDILTHANEVKAYQDFLDGVIGEKLAGYAAPALAWIDSVTGGNLKSYTHQQSTMIMEVLCNNHVYDDLKGDTDVLYRGRRLPPIWCAYYLDEITSEEAIELAKKTIAEHTAEGSYINKYANLAADIGFRPEREVDYLVPIEKGFELVRECAKNPHNRLFLFSNKNTNTMDELKARYPEFFALFGDRIITSGAMGMLKPNPKLYQAIVEKYGIDINHCYFIDSQGAYLVPAIQLGDNVKVLEINHELESDYDEAREHLIEMGIIETA